MISCSQNPFCSSLTDSVRKKLCTGCRQRLSRAGSTQLYDDFSKEVTLILDGAIYGASPISEADIGETEFLPLFVLCLPGRPLSLDAAFRDECGFADIPHGFNEVLCLTDCRIASFSHELFRSLFESDSAFASALMRAATGLMMDISQISAINNVLQTYRAQLAWGTVDVDSVLPQFLSELEAAGINEIIEANQEQLDAWLAEQE